MNVILAGDIGGTKTLLRLAKKNKDGFSTLYEQRFASQSYSSFTDVLREFMAIAQNHFAQQNLATPQLSSACFGIAGPVRDRRSQLTNLGWNLDAEKLSQELGISDVSLINDFVAVGYGVLGLQSQDIYTLQSGIVKARSPIAVIGAGTGLGEAYLGWNGDRYEVYPTEGGHTDFAPRNELEIELLKYLQKRHDRVSVERIASGTGIIGIYQFLRNYLELPESAEIAAKIKLWESGDQDADVAAAIAQIALANYGSMNIAESDRLAVQTMQMFVEAYASEIGNFALKLIPNGGLYIAGGIAPKILPLLQDPQFLAIIKSKGRVSSVLYDLPIHVVLNSEVGLIGAMFYAGNRLSYQEANF